MGGTDLCTALQILSRLLESQGSCGCGEEMCCNFYIFQLNAGAGSRAGSSLGRGPARVQGLLWCVGELEQELLGWAGHLPTPVSHGGHHQYQGAACWLQEMLRAMEGVRVFWERNGWWLQLALCCLCDTRPAAGCGCFTKGSSYPGPGFLQSRPAAPPPPRGRAVLPDGPQLMFPGHCPRADSPGRCTPISHGCWPSAHGPEPTFPGPMSLGGDSSPRVVRGQQSSGYPSNVFFLQKNLHMQTLMR